MVRIYLLNEVRVKEVARCALAYALYGLSFCSQSTTGRTTVPLILSLQPLNQGAR